MSLSAQVSQSWSLSLCVSKAPAPTGADLCHAQVLKRSIWPPASHPQPTSIYIKVYVHIIYFCTRGQEGRHWGLCVATARCLPARHSSPFVPAACPPPLPPHRKVPVGPASFLCLRCEWACHGRGGQGGLGDFSSSREAFWVGRAPRGMGCCLSASAVPGCPRVLPGSSLGGYPSI